MLVKEAAAQAAEQMLDNLWDGSFPIDPRKFAEANKIRVQFACLIDDISGAIIAEEGKGVTILVEENEPFARQRFSIAHELGHYVERMEANDKDYSFVERRGGKYTLHELYADTFAANLLMPEKIFRQLYEATQDESYLARYFAVSPQAVSKRVNKLGLKG